MGETFNCLYCGYVHSADASTLEHAIPQFLGGAHAPDRFRLRNVCRKCNNDLGAFVDASFAKSWPVTNNLASAARKLYDGADDVSIPLACMGPVEIPGVKLPPGHVTEFWLGPSGEHAIWLRPGEETLYWYTGGNPRNRSVPSTVYWFPTSDDPERLEIGFNSLFAAFKKHKKARRILGVPSFGYPGGYPLGFDAPNTSDAENIAAIRGRSEEFHVRLPMNVKFDCRFIAKIALGIGYSLFGDSFSSSPHAQEFRKGCWPKGNPEIDMRGTPTFGHAISRVERIASYPGAVVVVVLLTGSEYVLLVTIDEGKPFIVSLAPARLQSPVVDVAEGYALMLFPSLRSHIETTFASLIGHRLGSWVVPPLKEVDARIARSVNYWASLPAGQGAAT